MTGIPAPFPGEILSSWLQRCAEAHGTDVMGWTYGFWGDWRAWTRDIDRSIPEGKLLALSRFSGVPPQRLREATLEPWIGRMHGGRRFPEGRSWPWVIPLGVRNRTRTNGIHFCPGCLGEEPAFFRLHWRFSWHTACPRHGEVLWSRCPGCGQVFSPHLADWSNPGIRPCSRCGLDLSSIRSGVSADPAVLSLQEDLAFLLPNASPEAEERFAFVRDLAILFRNMRKRRALFARICRSLGMEPRGEADGIVRGTVFDSEDPGKRHFFLGLSARFAGMDFRDQTELLRRHLVTENVLADLSPLLSSRMGEIRRRLDSSRRRRKRDGAGKATIRPRDEEEAEEAMDEIRRFL